MQTHKLWILCLKKPATSNKQAWPRSHKIKYLLTYNRYCSSSCNGEYWPLFIFCTHLPALIPYCYDLKPLYSYHARLVRGYSDWLILITSCLVMLLIIKKLLLPKYYISPVPLMCTDKCKPCPFLSVPRNTFLHNISEQCQCPQDSPRLLDPKYDQHYPMRANPNPTLLERELHLGPSKRENTFNP